MASDRKILPVALSDTERSMLRTLAFERSLGMAVLIREWIEEKWANHKGPQSTPKTSQEGVKQTKVNPELVGSKSMVVSLESPATDLSVGRKCAECNLITRTWVYDKKGKPICPECSERLAGGNP